MDLADRIRRIFSILIDLIVSLILLIFISRGIFPEEHFPQFFPHFRHRSQG